ncbi:hypothetical protein LPJ59_004598 [Coemansia sp. RSA 2399]|nr:hypothetical protein LPJ59_004598 [Coemansia sp. RSA 2399]
MSIGLPESVAKQLASDVRALMDESDSKTSSTYIPSYSAEFLDDAANSYRVLQACDGDMRQATVRLARTLEWRQQNKVYPARKYISSAGLIVDMQGLVVVHAQTLVRLSVATDNRCTCGGEGMQRKKEKNIARAVSALEDVRVALKAVGAEHGRMGVYGAVVVPVESLSLGDICMHDVMRIVDIGRTHYGAAVQQVYVTATSSVLLEHARQAMQPVLAKVPEYAGRIAFVMADALDAQCTRGASVLCAAPSSLCCTEDDFCSAYSHAPDEPADTAKRMGTPGPPLLPTSLSAELQPYSKHEYASAQRRGSTDSSSGGSSHHSNESSAATPIQLASLQRAVQGVQRMLGSLNDSIVGAESRAALAATRSKLVQQADVLMSTVAALNFGVSAIDDTTTGSRVPSYFERRGSSSSSVGSPSDDAAKYTQGHRRTLGYQDSVLGSQGTTTGGLLRVLVVQLAALPVSLLLGKKSRSLSSASLSVLVVRIVRRSIGALRAMPAMHSLLLLAYKHFRIYAIIAWTAALLVWQANAAMIWSNLTLQWKRGIA